MGSSKYVQGDLNTSSMNTSGGDRCVKLPWAAVCRGAFDEGFRRGLVKAWARSVILCEKYVLENAFVLHDHVLRNVLHPLV